LALVPVLALAWAPELLSLAVVLVLASVPLLILEPWRRKQGPAVTVLIPVLLSAFS